MIRDHFVLFGAAGLQDQIPFRCSVLFGQFRLCIREQDMLPAKIGFPMRPLTTCAWQTARAAVYETFAVMPPLSDEAGINPIESLHASQQ